MMYRYNSKKCHKTPNFLFVVLRLQRALLAWGHISTRSIPRKYKPNDGTFQCLKSLILRLLTKIFVAKWSWMRRFSDWLGFCRLPGNVNERAPSHKATFEESVIRWLPLCLLNCSSLLARCMTPCHLQGSTPGSICVRVCARVWKCAQEELKAAIRALFCHFNTFMVF